MTACAAAVVLVREIETYTNRALGAPVEYNKKLADTPNIYPGTAGRGSEKPSGVICVYQIHSKQQIHIIIANNL